MSVTPQKRADVTARLDDLSRAIQAHPQWPSKPPSLYFVWDFVGRSKYMLAEYDSIVEGKALKHPEQFRPAPGKGRSAADAVANDCSGRTMMIHMLVNDRSGKMALMTGGGAGSRSGGAGAGAVDFGEACRDRAMALSVAATK